MGFKRKFGGKSLEYVSEQKSYGNEAEIIFFQELIKVLPGAIIKSNIIVETTKGKCEIDTLIRYNNKLFIIEIKHWKGILTEANDYFFAEKEDKYTDDTHLKKLKSPFGQVKRQSYLLKEMTNSNPWINTIVFFCDADDVTASEDNVWFVDFDELVDYIKNQGNSSSPNQIDKCLSNCKSADFIYSPSRYGEKSLHCIIEPSSLVFDFKWKTICKDEISEIKIIHHISYDDLKIKLKNGNTMTMQKENASIKVLNEGKTQTYSLAKIEYILIGN